MVNGKQLTVGVVGGVEVVLDKPMTPSEIQVCARFPFLSKIHFVKNLTVFRKLSTVIALLMTLYKLFCNKKFYFTVDG